MKIREILACIGPREIPTIGPDSQIDGVIRVLADFSHTRVVYVVNGQRRLVGTIAVGALLRQIYPHHYEGKIHALGILAHLTASKAGHLMVQPVTAHPDETAEDVLRRMAASGVKEIAVVDESNTILGDITANDLLRYYYLNPDPPPEGRCPP